MNKCGEQRIEKTERSERNADSIDQQRSGKVRHNDPVATARNS